MVRTKKQHASPRYRTVTLRLRVPPRPWYATADDVRRANEDKRRGARLTGTVCKRLVPSSAAPVRRKLDAHGFTSPVEFVAAVRACSLAPDVRQTFERALANVVHPDLVHEEGAEDEEEDVAPSSARVKLWDLNRVDTDDENEDLEFLCLMKNTPT